MGAKKELSVKAAARGQSEQRLKALQEISVKLMTVRHPRELLYMIVNKAVDLLNCDAGTLYLRSDAEFMVFEVAVNKSVDIGEFQRTRIPISKPGLAAYVCRTGKSLRIKNVYSVPKDAPYTFDSSFDKFLGYRTRSTLVQPLRGSKGEILGVLQLINRKKSASEKWPHERNAAIARMPGFSAKDESLLESFAAVASAGIENAALHKNIEELFEGFVKASVHAIESRDAATRGHSDRVAILTVDLARRVHESTDGDLKGVRFSENQISEIRYASLLHDFGKIGVRESTLQKEEKLSNPKKFEIQARFLEFKRSAEIKSLRAYVNDLIASRRVPNEIEIARINRGLHEFGQTLDENWKLILELCKPTVLDEDKSHRLTELKGMKCEDCDGHMQSVLKHDEIQSLSILRGSLSDEERLEIESHVTKSFEFLKKIPWTGDLAAIPEIAFTHHERLNGSGYPRGIKTQEIPVQAKIMAVTDVYDALTANDRPYKPALSPERALNILEMECKAGKLDPRFFRVFLEARVFECPEIVAFNDEFEKKAA